MRKRTWLLSRGLAAFLPLCLTALLLSADDSTAKKTDKEPPDPPGTSMYMTQFRALFDAWDLNGDGYLDKEELAKAFRGPRAKPYDYKPAPKPKKDDKDDPKDDPKKDDPKDDKKDNEGSKSPDSSTKKPNYTKFPDYNFLVALDQDNDEQISRKEFLSWARDTSVQLKQQADSQKKLAQEQQKLAQLQNKVAQLQQKLANATKKSEIKKIQADLNKEQKLLDGELTAFNRDQAAMNKLAGQIKGIELKTLQQQLQPGKKH